MTNDTTAALGRLLVIVEDTFAHAGRIVLKPFLSLDAPPLGPLSVVLVRPDGSETRVDAVIEHPFFNPPPPGTGIMLSLRGLPKAAVPIGTRIHLTS